MAHASIRTSYDLGPEGRILIASLEADPALGEEPIITVPGRAVWDVLSLVAIIDTEGTAATRSPVLNLDDGENTFAIIPQSGTATANTIRTFIWMAGAAEDVALTGGRMTGLIHPLTMLPGWRLRIVTGNFQAGDNWTAPVLYIRETPQRGLDVGQEALLSALRRLIDREV